MSKTRSVEDLLAIAFPFGNAPAFEHSEACRSEFSFRATDARRARVMLTGDLARLRESLQWQDGSSPGRDRGALYEQSITSTEQAIIAMDAQIEAASDLAALAAQPEGTTLDQLYSHRERQAAAFAAAQGAQQKPAPDPPAKPQPVRPWYLPD